MRIVVQRCSKASVSVEDKVVGEINKGLVLLVGFTKGDNIDDINYLIDKVINLRIFEDLEGKMNKSLLDIEGSILSISQFTLYADCKKGRRPSFVDALSGDESIILYDKFNDLLSKIVNVKTGVFGASMDVSLTNQGPVTIILESRK